jgi:hypothetical protein
VKKLCVFYEEKQGIIDLLVLPTDIFLQYHFLKERAALFLEILLQNVSCLMRFSDVIQGRRKK